MNRHLILTATFAACCHWTVARAEEASSPLISTFGPPPIVTVSFNEGSELVDVQPLAPARLAEELVIEENDDILEPAKLPIEQEAAAVVEEPVGVENGDEPQVEAELIRERFPDGTTKLERYVIQDDQQNYINHGSWKMWDIKGNVIAEGDYHHGKRHGEWVGWFFPGEVTMLQGLPYNKFTGPFVSQAQFRHGELHGAWTIYDSSKRTASEFYYENGKRHGIWTWWYPDGQKMREMEYSDGEIDGELAEWREGGEQVGKDTYIKGRRLGLQKELFDDGSQKSAGMYLHAQQVPSGADDWWVCDVAPFMTKGRDEKHGAWTSWHPNGQERMRGEYRFDVPVGSFTWWHPNGQKALAGEYTQGLQDGDWTWWHDNGLKSIQGQYTAGKATGQWIWWKSDGKVAQRANYDKGEQATETADSGTSEPARLK